MDGLMGFERRWFAVKSKPRKEAVAAYQLSRQGFATFYPTTSKCTRKGRQIVLAPQAFFPGYLFVRLNLEIDRWRSVNGTIGVSGLVQFGDRPSPTPCGFVETLVAMADDDGEVKFEDALKPGMKVRLVGGAFDNLSGLFECEDGAGRARVLLNMLAREMSVTVPRDAVMAW